MLNVSSRLQAAVEKLLEAISETSSQVTCYLQVSAEFGVDLMILSTIPQSFGQTSF